MARIDQNDLRQKHQPPAELHKDSGKKNEEIDVDDAQIEEPKDEVFQNRAPNEDAPGGPLKENEKGGRKLDKKPSDHH